MSPVLFLAVLLAVASAQTDIDRNEYFLVALAVATVGAIIIGVAVAWAAVRRNPPIEREIDERIDLKLKPVVDSLNARMKEQHDEMLRLNQERRVTVAGLFQKLEDYRKETKDDMGQLSQSIQKSFQDLNYSIGSLEGQLKGRAGE